MIDVKKTRNNFQKFPSLKQKCDPVIVAKQQTAIKATTPQNIQALKNKNQTVTKSTTATTIHSSSKAAAATPSIKTNGVSSNSISTNPVREANQHFFLVPEFKDQNFLKAECELAHAQVYKPTTVKDKLQKKTLLPAVVNDNHHLRRTIYNTTNNNSFSNNNNSVSIIKY